APLGPVVGPSQVVTLLAYLSTTACASEMASARAGTAAITAIAATDESRNSLRFIVSSHSERSISVAARWRLPLFLGGRRRRARRCSSPSLRIASDADRDEQGDAVEQRFDEERAAELLDARDANRQDGDADQRAPDVDATRLDRGRPQEGPD